MTQSPLLNSGALPSGVRPRYVDNGNGLEMHILEAGFESGKPPCVVLLHGFPELGYSWRKIMAPIAAAGYYVVAPDQRGYGATKGWTATYDGELKPFRMTNLVNDVVGLLSALDYKEAVVMGHDFGSPVAAYCALMRPDVFRAVSLMSAPFTSAPKLGSQMGDSSEESQEETPDIHKALAALDTPRKHYQWYYSTREADRDMWKCPQGLQNFLRAYYHCKSADWSHNKPFPLKSWTASELAKLPTYYIMQLNQNMAETVATEVPTLTGIEKCRWLTEEELEVYSHAFEITGFQGGLQWYRCSTTGTFDDELKVFDGKKITVPSCFIAGKSDWGVYQKPGAFEQMQTHTLSDFRGCHLINGAGHWVQQEQPAAVSEVLIDFLHATKPPS